jgi:hypothetical protein
MPLSMRFLLLRLIIAGMLVASQLYLFVRGYRVLRLSRWSPQRKKLLRLTPIGFFKRNVKGVITPYAGIRMRGSGWMDDGGTLSVRGRADEGRVETRVGGFGATPYAPDRYLASSILRDTRSRAVPNSFSNTGLDKLVASLAPSNPPKKKPRHIRPATLRSTYPSL